MINAYCLCPNPCKSHGEPNRATSPPLAWNTKKGKERCYEIQESLRSVVFILIILVFLLFIVIIFILSLQIRVFIRSRDMSM